MSSPVPLQTAPAKKLVGFKFTGETQTITRNSLPVIAAKMLAVFPKSTELRQSFSRAVLQRDSEPSTHGAKINASYMLWTADVLEANKEKLAGLESSAEIQESIKCIDLALNAVAKAQACKVGRQFTLGSNSMG